MRGVGKGIVVILFHLVFSLQIKAEDPTEMPPAPAPAPAPPAQQTHLPQAQLMLAGSQLAGVSGSPSAPAQILQLGGSDCRFGV